MPYSRIGKSLLEFNLEIMQRKILLIISIFVFITFSQTTNAQSKKKSDAEIEGLKGEVMSVNEKYYIEKRIFFGLIPIKEESSYEHKIYNKEGKLVFEKDISDFREDNWNISYYKYDNRGNCIEQIDSNYEDGSYYSRLWQYTFNYDEKGNIIEKYVSLDGKHIEKYSFKYDNNGDYIEKISSKFDDEIPPIKEILIRDNKGNIIERKEYSYFGNHRYVFKYDDKGNKIKEAFYNQGDTLSSVSLFDYNEKNDIIEQIDFFIYEIDTENNTLKFKYKYDSKGNWIKQIVYINGSIEFIAKRKIEYYKD